MIYSLEEVSFIIRPSVLTPFVQEKVRLKVQRFRTGGFAGYGGIVQPGEFVLISQPAIERMIPII